MLFRDVFFKITFPHTPHFKTSMCRYICWFTTWALDVCQKLEMTPEKKIKWEQQSMKV